jgi:hypothetical protein
MTTPTGRLTGGLSATESCGSTIGIQMLRRLVVFDLKYWPIELYLALSDQGLPRSASQFMPSADALFVGPVHGAEGRRALH